MVKRALPSNDETATIPVMNALNSDKIQSLREHTSWTQLQMYMRCSMQYYFRYVLGHKERPKLIMSNGSAGHEALELNAKHKIASGEDQPLEQIISNYDQALTKELADFEKSDFEPDDSIPAIKDATTQSLTVWRVKEAPLVTPITAELEFTIPLPETETFQYPTKPVTGKIDRISKRLRTVIPGRPRQARTEVVDYKFPQRLPSNLQELANMNDQLTTYDLVLTMAKTPTDDLGFEHFVPPTKTIPSRILQTYRSPELMTPQARVNKQSRLLYKFRTVSRAITSGIFLPTDNPQICGQCGFRQMCQSSLVKSDYDALQIRQQGAR